MIGRNVWRTGVWALALGLLLLAGVALGVVLIQGETGVRLLAQQSVQRSQGRLQIDGVSGTLAQGVQIAQVRWQDTGQHLQVDGVRIVVSWTALLRGRLVIEALEASRVHWQATEPTHATAGPPTTLQPPIDLEIQRLQIEQLRLQWARAAPAWVLGPLSAYLRHDQKVWTLNPLQVSGAGRAGDPDWIGSQGALRSLELSLRLHSSPPYALEARLTALPRLDDARWRRVDGLLALHPQTPLTLTVQGELERLTATLTLPGQHVRIRASGQWQPWAADPIGGWSIHFAHLDPARLRPDWPVGQWSGHLVSSGSAQALAGRLDLINAMPGSIDEKRWPLARIQAAWRWSDPQLQLDDLRWEGPAGTGQAQARLDLRALLSGPAPAPAGTVRADALELTVSSKSLDLRGWADHWPATQLQGQAQLRGQPQGWRMTTQWRDPTRELDLQAQIRLDDDRLTLDAARLTSRSGGVVLSGRLSSSAGWQIEGRFDGVEPSQWFPTLPPGAVRGPFALSGSARDLRSVRANLQWGPARFVLSGALMAATDRLDVRVGDLPLAWVRPGWGGRLEVSGQVVGAFSQALALDLTLRAQEVAWGGQRLTTAQARVQAQSGGPAWLAAQTWRGRLLNAELSGPGRATLMAPNDWHWTGQDLLIGPSRWTVAPAGIPPLMLQVQEVRWGASGARLRARIPEIPLSTFDRWLIDRGLEREGPQALVLSLDADLEAPSPARLDQWRGEITLARARGDLRIQTSPQGPWIDAGLEAASLILTVRQTDLEARWSLVGRSLGPLSGQLSAVGALGPDGLHRRAPLLGEARLDLSSLAFARAWMGEAWQLDGAIQAELRLTGTLEAPRWQGKVVGRELRARQQALGMTLHDGQMQARLIDDRVEIDALDFQSGDGRVRMRGVLRADDRSEAQVILERFPVPLGPGQRLVLSGQAQARLERGELHWRGGLRADEGVIEITTASTPRLSADVRVRSSAAGPGAGAGERAASESRPGFRVVSDLQIDLGDRLRVFGSGLDAQLRGELRLTGRLPEAPKLHGTVRTRSGTYRGLGQVLQIERGTLVFSGDIEDPAIDLLAWRRFQPVEAGVSLAGTARRPLLTLVSRPDVPEPDKLSWLVLGTAFDASRTGQNAALQAAAALLVSGADARSPLRGLVSGLGLDVLTVRTSTAGAGDTATSGTFAQDSIITLGKRLTDRIFLSYEQSLRGLQNLFRLQYQITDRLTVRARAGSDQSLDLIWSRRYD